MEEGPGRNNSSQIVVKSRSTGPRLRCVYCRDRIHEAALAWSCSCGARLHTSCHESHGGCTTLGCRRASSAPLGFQDALWRVTYLGEGMTALAGAGLFQRHTTASISGALAEPLWGDPNWRVHAPNGRIWEQAQEQPCPPTIQILTRRQELQSVEEAPPSLPLNPEEAPAALSLPPGPLPPTAARELLTRADARTLQPHAAAPKLPQSPTELYPLPRQLGAGLGLSGFLLTLFLIPALTPRPQFGALGALLATLALGLSILILLPLSCELGAQLGVRCAQAWKVWLKR